MLFNSFPFLLLFLLTFSLYYLPFSRPFQVIILIIASLIFYAWEDPTLLILLLISITLNTLISYQVARTNRPQRLYWALGGIALNLGILGLFKYSKLLTSFLLNLLPIDYTPNNDLIHLLLTLPLPIGISFYTFEGISLVVDILREREKETITDPQEKYYLNVQPFQYFLNTSFFVSFFPHLIAGPILKANDFYPQIGTKYFKDIAWGLVFRSLVTGYFLKMVLADNLKDYTFWISYPYYQGLGTLTNLTLLFGYSMQIFADFAGYSLIAIGLAATFGYQLPDNFNFPYISRSISEFWRRWHISLSSWLRSYLYIPLGGNRQGSGRTYFNLIVVMVLGGLWHGAAWSYGVWGLFHGLGLAVERLLGLSEKKLKEKSLTRPFWLQFSLDLLRVLGIFSFVSLGWLLFKLPQFNEAIDFIVTLFRNRGMGETLIYIVPVLLFSFPVILYHLPHFPTFRTENQGIVITQTRWLTILTDLMFGVMLALIVLNSGSSNAFIYFQF